MSKAERDQIAHQIREYVLYNRGPLTSDVLLSSQLIQEARFSEWDRSEGRAMRLKMIGELAQTPRFINHRLIFVVDLELWLIQNEEAGDEQDG